MKKWEQSEQVSWRNLMGLKLEIDDKLEVFLSTISPELEKSPSVHSLILSLAAKSVGKAKPPFRLLRGTLPSGELALAGLQTDPDRYLILSSAKPEIGDEFAKLLAEQIPSLPGVSGPSELAQAFAKTWCKVKICPQKIEAEMKLFELKKLTPARPCHGFLRSAKRGDDRLIADWLQEFHHEAVPNEPLGSDEVVLATARDGIESGHYFLWEDGAPVCLVGSTRETSRERWIGPVYTPPKWRARGYASALVEKVSEKILISGKKALLFTDLANPTSNKIYQDLGYVPLADFRNILFRD